MLIYTRPDSGISIVIPAKGITNDDLMNKSIPIDAINVRELNENDLPVNREFRNSWCDTTQDSRVDIDCNKAKNIQLERLREVRNKRLDEKDAEYMKALSTNQDTTTIANEMQQLRDATNPLKSLDCAGKVNDNALLQQIKTLGTLN